MRPDAYRAFTAELADRAARAPHVAGLVAVGSMAERDYGPDEWSDHDFFLITDSGAQERFRTDLSWLPRADEIVLSFRETAHGVKVVYADGHLLEFAVFDFEETALAGVNRYRVLVDRDGVLEQRLAELAARPKGRESDEHLFGMAVTAALVAAGRAHRGEVVSGSFFAVSCARHLCALIARHVPAERSGLLDDLDPLRRFEVAYPELGAEVAAALRLAPPEAAARLLELGERELRTRVPGLAWDVLEAVRLE